MLAFLAFGVLKSSDQLITTLSSHAWKVQQRVSWSIVLPLDMVEDGVELFEEETPSSDPL